MQRSRLSYGLRWLLAVLLVAAIVSVIVFRHYARLPQFDLLVILGDSPSRIESLAFDYDGIMIAAGSADELRFWWCGPYWGETTVVRGSWGGIKSLAFEPKVNGQALAAACSDGRVRIWNVGAQRLMATFEGHAGEVTGVNWLDGQRSVVSGGTDGTVRTWDRVTGSSSVRSIDNAAFTSIASGVVLAAGASDGCIHLWRGSVYSGSFRAHTDKVLCLTYAPDGRTIASGGSDQRICLWATDAGQGQGTPLRTLVGHAGTINAIAFHPGGRVLASASGDATIRLWDASTGTCVATLAGHRGSVCSIAFSRDGDLIASGGQDGTIRIWRRR